ncbi:MAG: carbohydrate porin [Planctomycetes bacterium]|nr:carbohydrate porin [Planctomycetota bacterium]
MYTKTYLFPWHRAVLFLSVLVIARPLLSQTQPSPPSAGRPATSPASQPATQPTTAPAEPWPANVRPFSLDRPTMTDDWFGLGKPARDVGIDMKFFWLQHWFDLMGGGLRTGSNKSDATMDWFMTFDLDKMGLVPGGDILVHAREQWGGNSVGKNQNSINRVTGANQQVNDDADGTRSIHVDQLWYRQKFFNGKVAIQLGHLDYQTIIDRNAYANSEDIQFQNAALDNNPVIPNAGQTGLGVAATLKPWDWYTLILGVGDAQRVLYQTGFHTTFHDEAWFMSYMEHGFQVKLPTPRGPLTGNYRFGLVYDPVPRTVFVSPNDKPDRDGNDYGFYTSFDQLLYREGPTDEQGLGWFFRYGWREDDLVNDAGANYFSQFWSTGLAYMGLLPTRDRDVMGLAVAQLLPSQTYRDRRDIHLDGETICEWYYAFALTPWCVITPDFQYINAPNGGATVSHALVGGIRVRVTF